MTPQARTRTIYNALSLKFGRILYVWTHPELLSDPRPAEEWQDAMRDYFHNNSMAYGVLTALVVGALQTVDIYTTEGVRDYDPKARERLSRLRYRADWLRTRIEQRGRSTDASGHDKAELSALVWIIDLAENVIGQPTKGESHATSKEETGRD